jgi:hypothetical protein
MNKPLDVKMIDWFDDHWYRVRYLDEAKVEVEDYFASVTTKLNILDKPHLRRWYGDIGTREAQRKMREAADRGTRIHWAWYFWAVGGAVVYQDRRNPAYSKEEMDGLYKKYEGKVWTLENQDEHYDFLKLVSMFAILKPNIFESEKKVFNIEHREAGTADNIMQLSDGEYEVSGKTPLKLSAGWYVGDLKTGAQVGRENFMQISAYVHCAESMGYARFQGALIYHTQSSIKTGIPGLKVFYLTRDEIDQHYADYRDISRVWERQNTSKPKIRQMPCLVVRKDAKWKPSTDSSKGAGKGSSEKKSSDSSKSPKADVTKPETKSPKTTSSSSSDKPTSTAPASKTPSKKE